MAEAFGIDRSWGEGVYHVLGIVSAVSCIATAPSQVAKLTTRAQVIMLEERLALLLLNSRRMICIFYHSAPLFP